MNIECTWNEKMNFSAADGAHRVEMDAKPPFGSDSALSPKQLLLAGLCGCTAMDVVALLKKHKQPLESFQIRAQARASEGGHPVVFQEVNLVFSLKGELNAATVLESVALSQTKFCGVSAMLSKAVPISYSVELNEENIGAGRADFG